MSVKSTIGNPQFLKKRVVPNPKYRYVRARIDTGYSLSKYMEKIDELRRNYRYKRDELFKRLKVTTFSQLVLQVASVNEQGDEMFEELQREEANSYPIAMLSRTMNPYTKELLDYKNASGKIILLYDEDERIASQAATTLCERGFENLFMLSGGLKVVAQMFPEGLTTGSIPLSCQPPVLLTPRRRHSTAKEPTHSAEDKLRFAKDDLNKIQCYLDEILLPSNSPSNFSRLSSSRTQLKTSSSSVGGSISARSQTGCFQNKPWK
ncbi:hypothetical protein scyTo_0003332 [Scyliorhinus torazame]|uniref:Rhodanese domain-containing protein n=1 Tax=Scyliorhinus torazame TaxID=75743 RepID=A0A401PM75_SCYTO|nr:hypothetical protein [Scyliorhinus torazame]